MSYNMKAPLGWKDFKKMPADLQQEYIQGLVDRFSVSLSTIGKDVFGVGKSTLSQHMRNNGIRVSALPPRTVGVLFKEGEWAAWLAGEELVEDVPDICAEEIAEPEIVKPAEPELFATNASFTFQGELNKMTLYKALESMTDVFGKVRVTINIYRVEE